MGNCLLAESRGAACFHGSEPSPALSWIEGFGDVTTFWGGNSDGYAKLPAYKHW